MAKDDKKKKLRKRKKREYKEEDSTSDEDYVPPEEVDDNVGEVDINDILRELLDSGVISSETEEDIFLKKLNPRKRRKLLEMEKNLLNYNSSGATPLKYKIIESDLEDKVKSQILQKISFFEQLQPNNSEYHKLKKYIEALEKIPFSKYSELEVNSDSSPEKIKNFIEVLKDELKTCTYGQEETKNSIVEVVARWITNPKSSGNILGLCGPPGVGKTSLIKNGVSKALKMPFSFIGLGGSTCSSFLHGHDYTYEGAKWGRIIEILIETKCMNPVIFFDELDKISETKSGEEIAGVLTHLTDPSQNNSFSDKYFSGIDFDLSKCFLIFSFNDINKINPILRDRLKIINLKGFKLEEKISIAEDFSIKKICKNIGFPEESIIFPKETLKNIIDNYCPEQGVRTLEKCLETIIMKLNLYKITGDFTDLNKKEKIVLNFPCEVTPEIADKLLCCVFTKKYEDFYMTSMYT